MGQETSAANLLQEVFLEPDYFLAAALSGTFLALATEDLALSKLL